MDSRSAVIGYRVGFIDRALIYHEGKIEILALFEGDLSRPVGWSNSGNLIFLGDGEIWSYKDGNFTKIMQPTSHRFYRAEWNAEKTEMILYGTYSYVLQYIDANNSIIKIETIDYQGGIGDVGWYPNNQELLIIGSRGTVFSFNGENITKLFSIHPEHEYNYISIEDFDVNELLNQALIVGYEWEGLIDATNQYTKGFIYLYDGSNFNQIDIDSDYVNKVEWNEQNSYAIIITGNDVWKYSNGELILLNENITRILALSFSSVENIGLLSGLNSSIYMLSDDVLIDQREEFLSCLV